MKKYLVAFSVTIALSGCASMEGVIPSFWDDNQAAKAIDIKISVNGLDCTKTQNPQVRAIKKDLDWFVYYSQAKGYLQKDVLKLIEPLNETVNDFDKRTQEKDASVAYCNIKKKVLVEQTSIFAKGVLGRY